MRRDVMSASQAGDEFGTRTETKNVNSVRFVMHVIDLRRGAGQVLEQAVRSCETRLSN